MKLFFLSFYLFISLICSSQQKNISFQNIKTYDKVLKGNINGKYDITIYLKAEKFSEDHMYAFSVKGWYYYNNVKKTIPLVGVYNPTEGLTLFNLSDKTLEKKILDLNFPEDVIWKKLEAIETIKTFNEKFTISDAKEKNTWVNNSKSFSLEINNLDDSFLIEDLKLLKIDKTVINLSKYSIYHKNLEIISKKTNPNETRILLSYEEMGNPNIQGVCGGAEDLGYIILIYNNKNELTYIDEIEIDNCRAFISSELIKTNNTKILKYKVTESSGDNETKQTITIDTEAVTLTKQTTNG